LSSARHSGKEPISVLHLSEAFGGGVQTVIALYLQQDVGAQQRVFGRARQGQATAAIRGGELTVLDAPMPKYLLKAYRNVWTSRPDFVHLHSSFAGFLRLLPLPKGTKVVYQPHCYAFERRDVPAAYRIVFRFAERLLARRRQTVVAVSPREVELARQMSSRNRVVLIPNPSAFEGASAPASLRGGDAHPRPLKVLMVGRLSPQKDPELYAGVANLLSPELATLTWVGDGTPEAREALEGASVSVTGWMSQEDVKSSLLSADLYLHTARWEGAPMTAIDAAALGTPVISVDIQSMSSLGYPIGGNTAASLAESVIRFVSDDEYRADISRQTARVAEQNSRENMRAGFEALYV